MSPADPSRPSRDDVFLTAEELSERWRLDVTTLGNLRWQGEGPPYVKLPSGSIRYRLTDILAIEADCQHGFRWQKLRAALDKFPSLTPAQKKELAAHLRKTMK